MKTHTEMHNHTWKRSEKTHRKETHTQQRTRRHIQLTNEENAEDGEELVDEEEHDKESYTTNRETNEEKKQKTLKVERKTNEKTKNDTEEE